MKHFKLIFTIILVCVCLTSCYTKSVVENEADSLLFEDYSSVLIEPDEINRCFIEDYDNYNLELSESDIKTIENYKDKNIRVGIPTTAGFFDEIDEQYLGPNLYSALQLEKDLGLKFDYVYGTEQELHEKLENDELDLISGENTTKLFDFFGYYNNGLEHNLSTPYASTNYSIYTKDKFKERIEISIIAGLNTAIYLPYCESAAIPDGEYTFDYLTDIDSKQLSESYDYLLLPDNVDVTKYSFYQNGIANSGYVIFSAFSFNENTISDDLKVVINKTITPAKEKNISDYQQSLEALKCNRGVFFTEEEIEFIKNAKVLETSFIPEVYPYSFYDYNYNVYNGKLPILLHRISDITGLKFEPSSEDGSTTIADINHDLYYDDIDLAVGIAETFNRGFYAHFSSDIFDQPAILIGYDDSIHKMTDFNDKKIGVIEGSSINEYLSDILPSKSFYKYNNIEEAYNDLKNLKIDYLASNETSLYYLINTMNDFDLKNAYSFNFATNFKFATPKRDDGLILLNIIDKTIRRVDAETIMNSKYQLSRIDTVELYRDFLSSKIFIVVLLLFVLLLLYVFYELNKTRQKERDIRELNDKLNTAFLIAESGIISYKEGTDYLILNENIIDLFGIKEEHLIKKDDAPCIIFDVFRSNYLDTNERTKEYFIKVSLELLNKTERQERFTSSLFYGGDKNNVKYFDVILTFDRNYVEKSIFAIIRDNTKNVLYEKYEKALSKHSESLFAKDRNSLYKENLSALTGKTVAYLDLDDFSQVNTTYGHKKGDEILNDVLLTLKDYEHSEDIYRMSGDEFFVVLNDFDEVIVDELANLINIPITFNDFETTITCSLGILTIKEEYNLTIEEIVNVTHYAMVSSRIEGGSNYGIVDNDMLKGFRDKNQLDSKLKSAILNGEIVPFFQPYIEIDTGRVVGYETLMRWKTNDEILAPFTFLSIAIKSGLIYDIDLLMFEESVKFLKYLQDVGLADKDFIASSNFTSITLMKTKPTDLFDIVIKYNISPKNITIEVTEQLFVDEKALQHIKELKELGFRIALDDFSVGHSSMSYLKKFNVDVLKLDKSLLDDSSINSTNLEIFKTVVNLGRSLNAKIVSEGVETKDDEKVLIETAVHIGQGYFYSKPKSKDNILEFIEERNGNN